MSNTSVSRRSPNVNPCDCDCQIIDKTQIVAPGCSDDTAAAAALPDDWTPKHSGPTLASYLKEQEQNHGNILENLSAQACRVNTAIDDKVRELAEILLAHIQDNQVKIDRIVQDCGTGEVEFTPQERNKALKDIHNLYNCRLEDISDFRQNALKLERERADGLRHLMRDEFQRLVAVAHKPPKDLLHDFDDNIYEVNQQLLSNSRAYSELEAELRAEADENVVKARSTLNQLCLGVITAYRCQSARRSSARSISVKRSVSATDKKGKASEPLNTVISTAQEELELCVTQLLEAYRQAVLNTFMGFSGKLQDLHKTLTNFNYDQISKSGHTPYCANLEEVIENVLRRISTSFHSKIMFFHKSQVFIEMTQNELMNVQKSLWSLGECLRDTYTILHDAGHLWDNHMLRSALAQKLTIAAVEDLLTNNDTVELANEVGFNQALESMISSSDEDKLNAAYVSLVMMLDNTADMYQKHSLAEIGRLEEFMKLPPSMSNILLAEFQCFLAKHPRTIVEPSKLNPLGLNTTSKADIFEISSIPYMIRQTELQEAALMNWRNGFLETFENNVNVVPEELKHQAQLWVNERSTALHMRNSLKEVSHNVRKERVKAAYEARLAELHHHESRLQSHLNAIQQLVVSLPEQASQFLSLDAPELYPITKWVEHIKVDMEKILSDPDVTPEVRQMKVKSYAPRLAKYRDFFDSSLNEQIYEYKAQVEHQIQNARISNVRFVNKIKLFCEGGRYSVHEAIKTSGTLLKTADMLDNLEARTLEALHNRRLQLSALVEHEILPLQKVCDDFSRVKGKEKLQGKKKK